MRNRIESIDPLDESQGSYNGDRAAPQNNLVQQFEQTESAPNPSGTYLLEYISGANIGGEAIKSENFQNGQDRNISQGSYDKEDTQGSSTDSHEADKKQQVGMDEKLSETKEEEPEKNRKWHGIFGVGYKLLQVYLFLFVFFISICAFYWGTYFHRFGRFKNLELLVVSDDVSFTTSNGTEVRPLIYDSLRDMFTNNETINRLGDWRYMSTSEISELASKHNSSNYDEVVRQVHHQKYWAAFYIAPNSTQLIYESMVNQNVSLIESQAIDQLITCVYESGRHYSALSQYVTKNLYLILDTWTSYYGGSKVYNPLVSEILTRDERSDLMQSENGTTIINDKPMMRLFDNRPSSSPSILGPSELGLIYAQMFSFHQFNLSVEVYSFLRKNLKYKHFVIWRIIAANVNCFILALIYSLITIAFRTPIDVAFGKAGFLVLWMFMYLFIVASASINELVGTIIMFSGQKQWIPVWLVSYLIFNISVTFSPLELSPRFYRYGYVMPMFNGYEALKVVFFNTWKGHLGRNIGILIIWIVVMSILMSIIAVYVDKKVKKASQKTK